MPMKKSKKIALCAILSAFSVLMLFIGAVIDVLSMTMVAIASMFVVVVMIEVGMPYPWLTWGVTSALSLILLPNKLPAILYFLFGGLYPIAKAAAQCPPARLDFLRSTDSQEAKVSMISTPFSAYFLSPDIRYALANLIISSCASTAISC